MDHTDDLGLRSEVLKFFCRHLVALTVNYEVEDSQLGQPAFGFAAYAGTLIEIGGAICFSHCGGTSSLTLKSFAPGPTTRSRTPRLLIHSVSARFVGFR